MERFPSATRRATSIAIAASILALLTACGGSSGEDAAPAPRPTPTTPLSQMLAGRSAVDLLKAAESAFGKARSVRVRGTNLGVGAKVALDVHIAGDRAKGKMLMLDGVRSAPQGVVKVGDRVFMEAEGKQAGYVEFSEVGGLPYLTLESWTDAFPAPDWVTIGGRTLVGGRPAIVLLDSYGGALAVAARGEALPLRLRGALFTGSYTFTYGQPVSIEVPEVVQ